MSRILKNKNFSSPATGASGSAALSESPTGKVFALLETLAQCGSARLTDLAASVGVPKTTLHRVTTQLEQLGYLQREPGGTDISISPLLIDLSFNLLAAALRLAPRHAILEQLAMRLGESCSLAIRVGYEVTYLDFVAGGWPLAFNFQPGHRSPLYCTSTGKLYLARMSAAELEQYLKTAKIIAHTPSTITDLDALRAVVAEVRASGFASTDNEFVQGVIGASVPVWSKDRRMLAGLTVTVPSARMSLDEIVKLRPALDDAAGALAETFD